jgi:spermidine dehydrogenase
MHIYPVRMTPEDKSPPHPELGDQELGMGAKITRRDFLDGVLIGAAAATLPGTAPLAAAPQDRPGYYPPRLTGMRGSHPGSFEAAHALRDGTFWETAPPATGAEQDYDLVIVGAGISGLAAAYFFRHARPAARILILDNHDDFGGHAKRNEFAFPGGRLGLINGGTLEIDSPRPYSAVAGGLLRALGIDPPALEKASTDAEYADRFGTQKTTAAGDFYEQHGMHRGLFLAREQFGRDALLPGMDKKPWAELLRDAPLTDAVKRDATRIWEGTGDHMPGLSSAEKKDRLSRISYGDYMVKIMGADPGVLPIFQDTTHDEWGVGIDAVSALDAWGFGLPGFDGLNLAPGITPRMAFTPAGYEQGGSYKFHFPDGNASIARLLVRALIPAAMPGHSVTDVVTARADYTQLDRPDNPVRIRLSSVVAGVRNIAQGTKSQGVELVYDRFGKLARVRAKAAIMACYNMMIPYLCPDMPAAQKDGLHYMVKTPLIYTSVAIRNWRAWQKLGVSSIYAPGFYHMTMALDPVTTIGSFRSVAGVDDPVLVHMVRTPCSPGLDERSQNRIGRAEILTTSLETFERNIRAQMGRILGPGGFDPARDITAITVNRWPHGYAYEYNYLFDPVWAPGQAPHEIGRRPFGRIFIANSDSGAGAYTDVAIDQGHRAVREALQRV